jgi:hypothetical protein
MPCAALGKAIFKLAATKLTISKSPPETRTGMRGPRLEIPCAASLSPEGDLGTLP